MCYPSQMEAKMIDGEEFIKALLIEFQANGAAELIKEKLAKMLHAYLSAGLAARLAGQRRHE